MDLPYKRLTNADLYTVAGGACKSQHQGDVSIRKECFDQMIEQLKRANCLRVKLCRADQIHTLGLTAKWELEHYMEGEEIVNNSNSLEST